MMSSAEAYERQISALQDVVEDGYDSTPQGRIISELHSAFEEQSSWTEEQIFRFISTLDFSNSSLEGVLLAKEKNLFEVFVNHILEVIEFYREEFDLSNPVDLYIETKGRGNLQLDVTADE